MISEAVVVRDQASAEAPRQVNSNLAANPVMHRSETGP